MESLIHVAQRGYSSQTSKRKRINSIHKSRQENTYTVNGNKDWGWYD